MGRERYAGGKFGPEGGSKRTAIHLLASTRGVGPICETDKGEALCPLGLSVPGQKDSGDTAEPLEEIPQLAFLCQLADL